MLPDSDRMEESSGNVWSCNLVFRAPCHRNGFHLRPRALGHQATTAPTPLSLELAQGEAKGAGVAGMGGTF